MIDDPLQNTTDGLLAKMVDAYGVHDAARILAKKAGFIDLPPTINQFVDDSEFLGGIFNLYPKWRMTLNEIYPDPITSPYLEVALTGAIGLGKTNTSLTGTAYDMMKLQYTESPTDYCGLARSTKLAFAMINANLDLAKGVNTDQLDEWMQLSPYFKRIKKTMKHSDKSYLPKNIHVITGSRFTHVLGMAVIGAVMSELNFQEAVKDQAYENYTNTTRRLKSRFQKTFMNRGSYPGRIWLDSSKNDQNSFVDVHLEENKDSPLLGIYDYAYWEVHRKSKGYPEGFPYCGKNFKVFIGDQSRDPFIIQESDSVIGLPEELIMDVPVEHQEEFEKNLPRALKDIAGKGTWSTSRLITSVERVDRACKHDNPWHKELILLDFFDKDQTLFSFMDFSKMERLNVPRFIHIDMALTGDNAGIACSRIEGFVQGKKLNTKTGVIEETRQVLFRTDWAIPLRPIPGHELPIYKIKDFINQLRAQGLRIARVSTDGFQSSNIRQDLTLQGFQCDLLSVDKTKDPYIHYRDAVLEGRWEGPAHPLLDTELKNLNDTGKKIDHPARGSKDLADACCGSVYNAFLNLSEHQNAQNADTFLDEYEELSAPTNVYDKIRQNLLGG